MGFHVVRSDCVVAHEGVEPPRIGPFSSGFGATHEIGLRDYPDDLAGTVDHGHGTNAVGGHKLCDVTDGCIFTHGNDRRHHHIARIHGKLPK